MEIVTAALPNGQWHREAGASLTDSHGMVVHVVLATGEAVLTEVPAVCEEQLPHRVIYIHSSAGGWQQLRRAAIVEGWHHSRSEVTKK